MTLQLNFRQKSLIWWKLLICDFTTKISSKVKRGIRFICKWQHKLDDNFTFKPNSWIKLFSMGIEQHYSHSNCIFDKGGFSVSSGLVFLCSAWYILDSLWFPMGPMIILHSDALIKLMCWFYVFNLPWSLTIPSVPLSHSSEDPLPLWSQSPVKGLKRLNSWWLLGPLWFTLSISPCPLSKFTTPKWGTFAPSFPSQRCFQVPPIGCRSCKP